MISGSEKPRGLPKPVTAPASSNSKPMLRPLPPKPVKPSPLKRKVEVAESEKPLDYKKRDRSKHYSIIDGSMYSITNGLTGNFISAFAVALGSSNTIIALLSSLPNLIGAVLQLGVQQVKSFFKTRKSYIVFFAVLQALMWLPLIFIPQLQTPGPWLLLFVTLNVTFGMLISPIWNSYMSDIVEEDERGRFFGRRNMFTGLTAFIATIVAGWLLSYFKPINPFIGFGILFALAAIFRILSAFYISKMDDPPEKDLSTDSPDIPEFIMNARKTAFGRFTIFLMLFYIAVYISSPFFAVYQLSILKFGYLQFTILACASVISSFGSMLIWGKYVDTIGSRNVLVASGLLIPLVPLGYALTSNFWALVCVEFFSGIVWAGFNLSVSTYLFDATDRKNRTRELSEYTLMIQVAIFVGALAGSGVVGLFDRTNPHAYITVFIVSAILRLAVVLLFYKTLTELRIVEVPIKDRIFKRFVSIKPHHGVVYEPAVETVPAAGKFTREQSKEIRQDMNEFARKAQGVQKPPSAIKKMEQNEYEEDFNAYNRKLKKDDEE